MRAAGLPNIRGVMKQAIFGSCVTRDALEYADPELFERSVYIARQSMISIGRPASDPALAAVRLASPFQHRLFHGDLAGDALTRIRHTLSTSDAPVCLVLDLVDERGGIFAHPDGAVITRSIDGVDNEIYSLLGEKWTFHAFGSMQHWTMYAQASQDLRTALEEAGVWKRTVVLRVKWAAEDTTGAPTSGSFGFTAQVANEILDGYYELLDMHGWKLITPGVEPIADPDHKWGAAPFHYTEAYYRGINDALKRALS